LGKIKTTEGKRTYSKTKWAGVTHRERRINKRGERSERGENREWNQEERISGDPL